MEFTKPTKYKILVIGRTGNGKSTICNVLTKSNIFRESEFGVSETKNYQIGEYRMNDNLFEIVDTIGIGDTSLDEKEVLFKIADACYTCRNGINQILFVTAGKFTEQEIFAYKLIQNALFDNNVTKYTTIIRTKFPSFKNVEKCNLDIEKMKNENDDNLNILKNCNRILYMNNLTIEEEPNQESRKYGHNLLLTHLYNCREIYKPYNLDELNNRIGNYMTEKELKEKEIKDLKEQLANGKIKEKDFSIKIDNLNENIQTIKKN